MAPPIPDRHRIVARVCELRLAGWPMHRIEELPGMPTRMTVYRWARAHPTFAAQLREARQEGWFLRRRAEAELFDAAAAEAFLVQVRRGRPVSGLVKARPWPHRELLDRWLALRPEFAAAFAEAKRTGCEARGSRRRPFDPALADRIVLRVMRGEALPQVMGDPEMPGRHVLRRWRRQRPEFDEALRTATGWGQPARSARRRRCTPELTAQVAARLRAGGSLHSIGGVEGVPHHVTLYRWVAEKPDFARAVRQACQDRDAILMDRALALTDAATPQTLAQAEQRSRPILARLGRLSRHPGDGRGE